MCVCVCIKSIEKRPYLKFNIQRVNKTQLNKFILTVNSSGK